MTVYWINRYQLKSYDRMEEFIELIRATIPLSQRSGAMPGSARVYQASTGTGDALLTMTVSTAFDSAAQLGAWIDKIQQDPEWPAILARFVGPEAPIVLSGNSMATEIPV